MANIKRIYILVLQIYCLLQNKSTSNHVTKQNCRLSRQAGSVFSGAVLSHMIEVGRALLLLVYLLYRQSFGESYNKGAFFYE